MFYRENEIETDRYRLLSERIGNTVVGASIVQAGHSQQTARLVYAQSARYGKSVPSNSDEDLVKLFMNASMEWHNCFGIAEKSRIGRNLTSIMLCKHERVVLWQGLNKLRFFE